MKKIILIFFTVCVLGGSLPTKSPLEIKKILKHVLQDDARIDLDESEDVSHLHHNPQHLHKLGSVNPSNIEQVVVFYVPPERMKEFQKFRSFLDKEKMKCTSERCGCSGTRCGSREDNLPENVDQFVKDLQDLVLTDKHKRREYEHDEGYQDNLHHQHQTRNVDPSNTGQIFILYLLHDDKKSDLTRDLSAKEKNKCTNGRCGCSGTRCGSHEDNLADDIDQLVKELETHVLTGQHKAEEYGVKEDSPEDLQQRYQVENQNSSSNEQAVTLYLQLDGTKRDLIKNLLHKRNKRCTGGRCGCTGTRCGSRGENLPNDIEQLVKELDIQVHTGKHKVREYDDIEDYQDDLQHQQQYETKNLNPSNNGQIVTLLLQQKDKKRDLIRDFVDEDTKMCSNGRCGCPGGRCGPKKEKLADDIDQLVKEQVFAGHHNKREYDDTKEYNDHDEIFYQYDAKYPNPKDLNNESGFQDLTRNEYFLKLVSHESRDRYPNSFEKYRHPEAPKTNRISPEDFSNFYTITKRQITSALVNAIKKTNSFTNIPFSYLFSLKQQKLLNELRRKYRQSAISDSKLRSDIIEIVFGKYSNGKVLPHTQNNFNIYLPKWYFNKMSSYINASMRTKKRLFPLTNKQRARLINKMKNRAFSKFNFRRYNNPSQYGMPFEMEVQGLAQINP